MFPSEKEQRARSWQLAARFVTWEEAGHNKLSPEFISRQLNLSLPNIQRNEKSLKSLELLSFIMPRNVLVRQEVPAIFILHCSHTIGLSTAKGLLRCLEGGSFRITVTCTPISFGPGTGCPDVTLHHIFSDFLRASSKDTGPDVDPNLFLRVDIAGNSDAQQATIADHEPRSRSWTFTATFDPLQHPDLVVDCAEVSENHVRGTLDQTVVDGLELFSFAMPQNRSSLRTHPAVHVTGVLNNKVPLRLRTVQSIFRDQPGLTVIWTPIHSGPGISSTSHDSFKQFLDKSTKDRSATANPNLLLRVDVRRGSDDAQPRKRGPQGPRKPKEPLDADMESIMALPGLGVPGPQKRRRAGRGSSRSNGSLDETAAPPPTPPPAAPTSAPSVIPRRPAHRQPGAHRCRRGRLRPVCYRTPLVWQC